MAEEKARQMISKITPLLNKIAKEQGFEKPEVVTKPLPSDGTNYTSKLFTVVIKQDKKDDLHLFAKVATIGDAFRSGLPLDLYKTEQFSYLSLTKIYAALEEENAVPEEHRLHFPKFYGYDPTVYQETMVLENLLAQGYVPHDRFQSFDWEYASSAVTDLAKMHALSFALAKQQPKEFEKTMSALHNQWSESESITELYKKSGQKAMEFVKSEYKDLLKAYLGDMKNPFIEIPKPVRSKVITHGDFRGANLMHRVREDGKVDIKIVDLQTLQRGSPVADLIYFIFTGSDEAFRAKHFDKLLEHYYNQITAAMKRLHLDPEETFSKEDFDFEVKEKLPFGLTLAVFTLPMITVEPENAPEVNESMELSNFSVEKTSALYAERLNGVVNDFVKWGILK